MTALVLGGKYVSPRGRKPSVPAFLYDFHNDTAGGTAVVDRFGNADTLTLQGTLGAAWTTQRGFWTPGGGAVNTDAQAIMTGGASQNYAAQSVLELWTPGLGIILAWQYGWGAAKTTANEVVLCLGRNTATTPAAFFGCNTAGSINATIRGTGASATASTSFGAGGDYVAGVTYSELLYIETIVGGIKILAWKDGVPVGAEQTLLWTDNGGAVPNAAAFGMPDGITVGAQRSGANPASPVFTQRLGASAPAAGQTRLANLLGLRLAAPNVNTAADLALELHRYPRQIGDVLAGL